MRFTSLLRDGFMVETPFLPACRSSCHKSVSIRLLSGTNDDREESAGSRRADDAPASGATLDEDVGTRNRPCASRYQTIATHRRWDRLGGNRSVTRLTWRCKPKGTRACRESGR